MEEFVPFLAREDDSQAPLTPTSRPLRQPLYPARIAVYDDMIAPPRVVVIEPCDITGFLTQIIQNVYRLMCEQGGDLPHSMIRELVENFIHAEFIEPTISILDHGQTLVFSDQGPGIANKAAAMKPSFSTATNEMKRYIRGVGSGLPMVESYLEMRHGTMTIEDNLDHGTIVTVSFAHGEGEPATGKEDPSAPAGWQQSPSQTAYQPPRSAQTYQHYQSPGEQGAQPRQPYSPTHMAAPLPWPTWPQPYQQTYQQPYQPTYQQPYQPYQQSPWPQTPPWPAYQTIPPRPDPYAQMASQAPGTFPTAALEPTEPFDMLADAEKTRKTRRQRAQEAGEGQQPTEPMSPVQPPSTLPSPPPTPSPAALSARLAQVLLAFGGRSLIGGKELQAALGLSPATASRRLKELETAGLATKTGQKYALTPLGAQTLEAMAAG